MMKREYIKSDQYREETSTKGGEEWQERDLLRERKRTQAEILEAEQVFQIRIKTDRQIDRERKKIKPVKRE